MDRATRRRVRYAAWMAFLVATPLLLAYALGYRFPSSGEARAPTVGALVVRTIPRGARVILDGAIADERSPSSLGGIAAGRHHLRIERPGYRPFEKTLEVVGGRVTEALGVRLVPVSPEVEVLLSEVSAFALSPDARLLAAVGGREVTLHPVRGGALLPNNVGTWTITLPRASQIIWSPQSDAVAILSRNASRALVEVLTTAGGRTPRFSGEPVGWVGDEEARFVVRDPTGRLLGYRPGSPPQRLAEGTLVATIHPSGVLFQTAEASSPLVLRTISGRTVPVGPPFGEGIRLLSVAPTGSIAAATREGTFLLPPDGQTWERLTGVGGATDLRWSPQGDLLALRETAFDLSVVNVSAGRSPLPRGRPVLLSRLSSPLTEVAWMPEGNALVVITRDVLSLLDADPRDGPRSEVLLSLNRGDSPALPVRGGDAVWTIRRTDGLSQLVAVSLLKSEDRPRAIVP